MQSIVQARNRARRVAKRRVRRDVLDALAVDIDLAAVTQAFKVLGAREGSRRSNHVFWLLPIHRSLRLPDGERSARVPCLSRALAGGGQGGFNSDPNSQEVVRPGFFYIDLTCERSSSVRRSSLNSSPNFDEDRAHSSCSNREEWKSEHGFNPARQQAVR
jgi:hypothetical protein